MVGTQGVVCRAVVRAVITAMLVCAGLLPAGCRREAERKPRRVGIIGITAFAKMADGFIDEMTKLGYVEGKDVVYLSRFADADPGGSLEEIARGFVDSGVDLIFAFPTEPAEAAKAATAGKGIPVVFGFAGLEGNSLVDSVRHPGGDVTGVRFTGPSSTAKRLEILMELVPSARRVGVFYDPNYANAGPSLALCRQTVASTDVVLVEVPTPNLKALQEAIEARDRAAAVGMDALLIMPDILSHRPDGFAAILAFADRHDLPIAGGQLFMADQGALFAFSPRDPDVGALCASLADRVFRGANAGDIPVVTPENHLALNYRRARSLGIAVPEGILGMATKIIQE